MWIKSTNIISFDDEVREKKSRKGKYDKISGIYIIVIIFDSNFDFRFISLVKNRFKVIFIK